MPSIKGTASISSNSALQKQLRSTTFPSNFSQKVNTKKIHRAIFQHWIEQKVEEILGFEDEIVCSTAVHLFLPEVLGSTEDYVEQPSTLSSAQHHDVDPRRAQLDLAGFLGEKEAAEFAKELWSMMLDAQESPTGIPRVLIEKKKEEIRLQREQQEQKQQAHYQQQLQRSSYSAAGAGAGSANPEMNSFLREAARRAEAARAALAFSQNDIDVGLPPPPAVAAAAGRIGDNNHEEDRGPNQPAPPVAAAARPTEVPPSPSPPRRNDYQNYNNRRGGGGGRDSRDFDFRYGDRGDRRRRGGDDRYDDMDRRRDNYRNDYRNKDDGLDEFGRRRGNWSSSDRKPPSPRKPSPRRDDDGFGRSNSGRESESKPRSKRDESDMEDNLDDHSRSSHSSFSSGSSSRSRSGSEHSYSSHSSILGRGQDQGPYLIRPHFLPQGVVIENIAVTVEDTVVEAKVAVAVEIEITEGDHPKVRGVTTIIVGEVEVTQEIAEGGNNSINDRGRVPNRPIHQKKVEGEGETEKIVDIARVVGGS
ncbi:LOW QUALITY PROTEIN: hypothetical protein ACHAXM_007371 [Skeletonema potamos]